ncbi:complexin-like isoform X2 [Mytilus californianus]|uniref:complexin-like isoform X2 n=1 Tax=Mytilus californianus TaxID=6549 RepID=UPI002245AA0C|nr:complexin-like isoform X2 [Mytilus californianus]
MAAFIAKQMVGNQLKSVKAATGGDKDEESKEDGDGGEDPEIEEARREAEEKRKEKHRKMEEERETMRQSIRDKYGIKKKQEEEELLKQQMDSAGRVGRKKKTPAELAAEANAGEEEDDEDEFAMPKNLDEFKSKVQDIPQKLTQTVGEVSEKCSLQ